MRATRASRSSRRWRGRRHWPALRSACRRWPDWTCCRRSRQPRLPWWSAATAGASLTKTAGCSGTARKASRCAEGAAAHLFAAVLLHIWRLLGDWRPTKSASRGLMCSCQSRLCTLQVASAAAAGAWPCGGATRPAWTGLGRWWRLTWRSSRRRSLGPRRRACRPGPRRERRCRGRARRCCGAPPGLYAASPPA